MEQHGDLLWFIDGRDLRDIVAEVEAQQGVDRPGNYYGARTGWHANPVAMALGEVQDDPFCFYEERERVPAYAWLLTCGGCADPSDFAVVADVEFVGDTIWWRDLRVMTTATEPPTRNLGLDFSFDATQYREALAHQERLVGGPAPPGG